MIFNEYAEYYDLFYKKKNYTSECKFLEDTFLSYTGKVPKTILDLGCGTGNHLIALVKNGYRMTGIDASAQMLAKAEQKLQKESLKAELIKGDIARFDLEKIFDGIICMFSVINYLKEPSDLDGMITSSARHMKNSSLLIFDFWNADAVENFYTPQKTKTFKFSNGTLERASTTKIVPKKKLCEVNYTCTLRVKGRSEKVFRERHSLRYFTQQEITDRLQRAGLEILKFSPFNHVDGQIKKNTWDITAVAKKIKS